MYLAQPLLHIKYSPLSSLVLCYNSQTDSHNNKNEYPEMTSKKLICVVGATGKQGGSVAKRFHDAGYQVHALTRTPSSPASQTLAAQGITPVEADLEDLPSLIAAFKGANVIFSVTNYWEPFFKPEVRQRATELDVSSRKLAYEIELQQGKNIADAAAATLGSLDENGFLVSTLSHAGQCSQGRFTEVYHFDAKAEVFPKYVQETYPELARKMSCIHTGYFFTSFNILPKSYLGRVSKPQHTRAFSDVVAARGRHCANGLYHSPRQTDPASGPCGRYGQLYVCGLTDGSWESVLGCRYHVQLD